MKRLCALFVACLGLSAAATASETPVTVARDLYARYAEGDADGFKRLWSDDVAPVHLADLTNEQRVKCITLVMFRPEEPRIDGDRAEVRAVAVLSRISRINGRTSLDAEHAVIGMKRTHDEWRIDRWSLKEDELVERVVAAKSIDQARSLVRENADLLDFAFYRGLRRKASTLINERSFDAETRLTTALRELAVMTADDGILSTTDVLESITGRMGPKPDVASSLLRAEEALALAEGFGDPDALGSALLNLVKAYQWHDGNSVRAAPLLERVLAARARMEDQGLVTRAASEMTIVLEERGDYRACFPYLQIAQDIATRLNNPVHLYSVEMMLGQIYADENDFVLAVAHAGRAQAFARKAHFEAGDVSATQMLARCYLRLGRTAEFRAAAAEVLERATGFLNDFASRARTDLALERLQHGDVAGASAIIEKAVSGAEKDIEDETLAQTLETLARVRLAQHRYDDAARAAGRAIELRSKQRTVARLTAWLLAARAHLALGDRVAAYAALRSAVDYGEQERAGIAGSERQLELLFEPTAAAYGMLVDLLVEDHLYDEAFRVAEKAKARALLDVLAAERSSAERDVPAAEIAEEQRLEQRLVEANRSIAGKPAASPHVEEARLDLESYRAGLDARYPRLHATRGSADLAGLPSLAPLLAGGKAALIEYVVSAHHVHLFIVQGGSQPMLTVRTVPIERAALLHLIDRFSAQLASRNAVYLPSARRLYDLLLEPAVAVAGPATLFSIVPDDALWRIPFESLVDRSGRFAVERRAFHYAPSAAVLLGERRHRTTNLRLASGHVFLGFGNPRLAALESDGAEGRGRFAAIPESEQEVRAIGRLLRPGTSTVYVGAEALESRSKAEAPGYTIVHFATHGVIDDANPMYSHLLLARREGDREDGALEAREMMKMHLSADLVVLSACDTARGDVHAGEGLVGMTWALFASGCPSVIASEWRAGSATTKRLMELFYRRWFQASSAGHPFAKAEALREARLSLLRDPRYRHPYYWSPFVLIGSAD